MKSTRQKLTKKPLKSSKKSRLSQIYQTDEDVFESDVSKLLAKINGNEEVRSLLSIKTLNLISKIEGYFDAK